MFCLPWNIPHVMWDPDTSSSWSTSFASAPPNPASQRQWQMTSVSYRWFFQNRLLSIKHHKASVHESTSRPRIPSVRSESSFPRRLRGQGLFPLSSLPSNISFLMSFSLTNLLKIAAALSPNLPPNWFSLQTLSNLYYGLFIHIFIVCVCMLSHVPLLATPWTVANQVPLSRILDILSRISRIFYQEYWSGLPCPSLGHLSHPGIEPTSPASPVSPAL